MQVLPSFDSVFTKVNDIGSYQPSATQTLLTPVDSPVNTPLAPLTNKASINILSSYPQKLTPPQSPSASLPLPSPPLSPTIDDVLASSRISMATNVNLVNPYYPNMLTFMKPLPVYPMQQLETLLAPQQQHQHSSSEPFVCINNFKTCTNIRCGKNGECSKCYMRGYMREYKKSARIAKKHGIKVSSYLKAKRVCIKKQQAGTLEEIKAIINSEAQHSETKLNNNTKSELPSLKLIVNNKYEPKADVLNNTSSSNENTSIDVLLN